MNSSELKRLLKKAGCTFEPGKGGHLVARRGKLWTALPVHGSRKEIPTGTVNGILKDLGLKAPGGVKLSPGEDLKCCVIPSS